MFKNFRGKGLLLVALGILIAGIAYYFFRQVNRNTNSANIKVVYTIPNDSRRPLIRTYKQSIFDKKRSKQQNSIKRSVLGKLSGETPLLEFSGKPKKLTFHFMFDGKVSRPEGEPVMYLTAINSDNFNDRLQSKERMLRHRNGYQVKIVDLFADKKLPTKYNVVAKYLLEIRFKIDDTKYVTFTAFTTGH